MMIEVSEYLHIYGEDKKRFNEKTYIQIQESHSNSVTKFELGDIELSRMILSTTEVNRIQGLLLHLTNCVVFKRMSIIPVDTLKRKQMIVLIMNYFMKIETEVKSKMKKRNGSQDFKIWSRLICPILLVNFKMVCEYFYIKKCPVFFKDIKAKDEAFRLIFSLINEIFDPTGLNTSLIFWQDAVSLSHTSYQVPRQRDHQQ